MFKNASNVEIKQMFRCDLNGDDDCIIHNMFPILVINNNNLC